MTTMVAHDGQALLSTLAAALIALERQDQLDSFALPYPDEAQLALDRTVLLCLLHGADPPLSLAELVLWCRERPVSDWPLDLPDLLVGPGDRLLDRDSGRPTELCHEWAAHGRDSAGRLCDREVFDRAMRACREYGEPDSYTAFRDMLVNRPVLTHGGMEIMFELLLEPVRDLLDEIYWDVPDSFLRDGRYAVCGRCRTLLTPVPGDGWWCERDRCRRQGPPPVGRYLTPVDDGPVRQLARPFRQFVTGPGRAEMDLRDALAALGLSVAMWPGYDSYDLRVTFPDGHVWAIDVKDWAHPALLGRTARPVPAVPPYDEGFWVVPRHRLDARSDYIRVFERSRPEEAGDLTLVTDEELCRRARRRLRGEAVGRGRKHA
ncbi:hypothetical protein [Actinomadura gamaensis]|uniref:REase associating with pPIWI RE domain-containing protein n=1 Tax=Actinomadura gamaensis TaxID=1763541 RepID=A0ABV9U2W9_9ACTN